MYSPQQNSTKRYRYQNSSANDAQKAINASCLYNLNHIIGYRKENS